MASEDEIRAAEARLGLRLPPSYRIHLLSYAIGAETYGPYDTAFDDPADPATAPADQLHFATWYPGAYRYPSFERLVEVLAGERDE